jgi:hypothetical protein
MQDENERPLTLDARTQQAVTELQATILERYPAAVFVVARSPEDLRSVHLEAIVDVDDLDEVGDLVVDRVVELQAEEGIPIHVIPLWPPERVAAAVRHEQANPPSYRTRSIPLFDGATAQPSRKA